MEEAMLRICARNLYGRHCPHESIARSIAVIDGWDDWSAYPESWPRRSCEKLPLGIMPLNDSIRSDVNARLMRIRRDLEQAGSHYPRDEVRKALAYWRIEVHEG